MAGNSGFPKQTLRGYAPIVKTIRPGLLENVVERLKTEFEPEEIWLFGSHAWGTPNEG
jgi:hypothetical protein